MLLPRHRVVAARTVRTASRGWPVRGLVMESLVPSVLEQRITTGTDHCTRRRLLNRYGENPPGPGP